MLGSESPALVLTLPSGLSSPQSISRYMDFNLFLLLSLFFFCCFVDLIYFSHIDTLLSQGGFPSGSQITQVGSYSVLLSIFFSGLSLCGIIVMTQNSPRKCVRKLGIAHLDFVVQYCGAVHAISVSPASPKVAVCYLSRPHFFPGIFP